MPAFTVQSHDASGDDVSLFPGLRLSIQEGTKAGVVGRHGAGKSTLLRIMAGLEPAFRGHVGSQDESLQVGYLPDRPLADEQRTTHEYLRSSLEELRAIEVRYNNICMDMEGREEEFLSLQEQMDIHNIWDLDARLEQAFGALELSVSKLPVRNLSPAERGRVALCALLLRSPEVLVLDDPMQHVDADTAQWLAQHLNDSPGTVIFATNDRAALETIADELLDVRDRRVTAYPGNYSAYLTAKHAEQPAGALAREISWCDGTDAQRQEQSEQRMQRFAELQAMRQGVEFESPDFRLPHSPHLGAKPLRFEQVEIQRGEHKLIASLSFLVRPGALVGVVGASELQKFALLDLLSGAAQPYGGTIDFGAPLTVQRVDSSQTPFEESATVAEALATCESQAPHLAQFAFSNADLQTRLESASPGLRRHVALAMGLSVPCNLLLLDGPTCGLDFESLRALEDALAEFRGSALLFSNDASFLNRVSTDTLAFENEGKSHFHAGGNYESYSAWRNRPRRRR